MAILVSGGAAEAQAPAASSSLPIGTRLTFVSEETVKPNVRPGSEFRVHLRDPLLLNGAVVAPANTVARLIVTARDVLPDGGVRFHVAVFHFQPPGLDALPVRVDEPVVPAVTLGLEIPVSTLARVADDRGKVRVLVPLPSITLSNDAPRGGYTPIPLKTPQSLLPNSRRGRRGPSPSPSPSPGASTSPTPAATTSPVPAASLSPSPAPAATPT